MVHVQLLGMPLLLRDLVASAVRRHPGIELFAGPDPVAGEPVVVITTTGSRASLDECVALIGERDSMQVYRVDPQHGSTGLIALHHDALGELTPDELIDHVLASEEQL
jgi:hypothetical protein